MFLMCIGYLSPNVYTEVPSMDGMGQLILFPAVWWLAHVWHIVQSQGNLLIFMSVKCHKSHVWHPKKVRGRQFQ